MENVHNNLLNNINSPSPTITFKQRIKFSNPENHGIESQIPRIELALK
jgi:hypothetical protein